MNTNWIGDYVIIGLYSNNFHLLMFKDANEGRNRYKPTHGPA